MKKCEKKMTQAYEDAVEMNSIEVEKIKLPEIKKAIKNKVDKLLGDLNLRYYEESYSLGERKEQIYSSDLIYSLSFNIFRTF